MRKHYFASEKNNSTFVCLLASVGVWSAIPPLPVRVMCSSDMPRRISSVAIKPALDTLKESLIPGVPVELSAAPVNLTDKPYFFATRASSSRLSICGTSVRCAVLRLKKKYTGRTDTFTIGI